MQHPYRPSRRQSGRIKTSPTNKIRLLVYIELCDVYVLQLLIEKCCVVAQPNVIASVLKLPSLSIMQVCLGAIICDKNTI